MVRNRHSSRLLGSAVFFSFAFLALFGQVGRATDILNYRSHVFVTGDYVLDSTPLSGGGAGPGMATGNFTIQGVPCTLGVGPAASIVPCTTAGSLPAEIVSANVYWETIYPAGYTAAQEMALRNGVFDGKNITAQPLGANAVPVACWGFGGAPVERVYVADVLRYLPFDNVNSVRQANGSHTIALPSVGNNGSGQLPFAEGATLVVVYRVAVPGKPDIMPLRAMVTYAGTSNMAQSNPAQQVLGGFYQLAPAAGAKMTWIVGDASSKFKEFLTVNGLVPAGVNQTNPFGGAQGGGWNALTFNVSDNILSSNSALNPNPNVIGSLQTQVVPSGGQSACLSFGVILFSGLVQNPDNDGILPVWKTSGMHFDRGTMAVPATFGTCTENPFPNCVPLHLIGGGAAAVGRKQIYLQLDWMHGNGDGTGGTDGHGSHVHKPLLQALEAVYKSFQAHNIDVFFDVGNNYQNLGKPFIIPAAYAQGGHDDDESLLACINQYNPDQCAYDVPYSVLSYRLGFAFIRDGNKFLKNPILAHMPPNGSVHIFHYALMGHSLAGPFNANGTALDPNNPGTRSGIGDRPGGGFMVTFGGWRSRLPDVDMVGDWKQQAGTIMHELGHNLNLLHGGWVKAPQCGPNYPSVMSYSNQTRLNTIADGSSIPDYSNGSLNPLNDGSLPTAQGAMGPLMYKARYFAPYNPNTNTLDQTAKVHCDGSPITDAVLAMRLETKTVAIPDWSNGTGTTSFDVNFDGILGQTTYDSPDWSSLNLLQVSAQPNFGSISVGAIATEAGAITTDAGAIATEAGAITTDAGAIATEAGAITTDAGAITTDVGAIATEAGDEDQNLHNAASVDPPQSPTDCPGCGTKATNELNDILVTFTPPASGLVQTYNIYRCRVKTELGDTSCTPGLPFFASVPGTTPSFTDVVTDTVPFHAGATCPTDKTCTNTKYVYSVTDVVPVIVNNRPGLSESGPSNTTDPTEVTRLFVIPDSKTVMYDGTIQTSPALTFQVYGDFDTPLNLAAVTCTGSRNVGTNLPIVCSGPATTSSTTGVTYNAPYLSYTPGTLTITKRPITVTAAASSKSYDGTTAAGLPGTPTITSALRLGAGDSVTWTETYDNPNLGGSHLMTPAGVVNDTNGGNNYNVAFVTINTGVITPAALVITPDGGKSKTYGNIFGAFTGTVTGLVSVNGVSDAVTVTYASAGAPAPAHVGKYDITVGTVTFTTGSVSNYTITKNTATKGLTVNPAPVAFTFSNLTQPVTGLPLSPTVTTDPAGIAFSLSGAPQTNPGTYQVTATATNPDYVGSANAVFTILEGFTPAASMITSRSYHTATLLNDGRVLVTGGLDGSGKSLASAEVYSLGGTWTAVGTMPNKADHQRATLLPSGKVFISGGGNASTQIFDPATNTFTGTGGMASQRSNHIAVYLNTSGKVLIAGGSSNNGAVTSSAQLWDPSAGAFSNTGNMTVARELATATVLPNGKVLIVGGRSGSSGPYLSTAELYDPIAGTFAATGSMPDTRYGHEAVLLPNGTVLVFGGSNGTADLATAFVYDPATGTFSSTGSLATARRFFTSTVLNGSGRVLAAGGRNTASPVLNSAEVYNSASNTVSATGSLNAARVSHTATLLTNGKVLVTGGIGSSGSSINSSELFNPTAP